MEKYFAFFHVADPAPADVLYVLFLTQEDADAQVTSDPTLGYVEAPGAITPADYFVADGLLFRRGETDPAAPVSATVHTYAFYMTDDPAGTILFAGTMTEDDAELTLTDIDMAFVESAVPISNPADWYVSGGLLTAKTEMALATDKTSITADGVDTATITGIPAGTLVTLQRTADFAEQSETVTGSTTLKTRHKLAHVLRFECFPYRTTELTINGI